MTDHQEKARELLAIVEKAPRGRWFVGLHNQPELGPVADRYESPGYYDNLGVMRDSDGENIVGCYEYMVFKDQVTADAIAILPDLATELRAALDRETALRAEVERLRAITSNTIERINRIESTLPSEPSAFTGRITGRNRPDIPSDAGVPTRDQWAGYGEGWSVGPAMCNDPEGRITEDDAVSRAIGQPNTRSIK